MSLFCKLVLAQLGTVPAFGSRLMQVLSLVLFHLHREKKKQQLSVTSKKEVI